MTASRQPSHASQVSSVRDTVAAPATPAPPGRRNRRDEIALATREVVEQLTLAGRRARADVVQTGAADATGEDQIGGGLDDTCAGGGALRRQMSIAAMLDDTSFLDHIVHTCYDLDR